jgi:2,3-bisphosphoglycerate-dependent phosphoglycerate mutase
MNLLRKYSTVVSSPFKKNVKYQFYLVRHGESIWNKSSRFTGWTNIPLTSNGKEEAANMGYIMKDKLRLIPDIIYSSVLKRSLDTSSIIKDKVKTSTINEIDIHTTWRLNEKHYGRLEGACRQDFRDLFGDKFTNIIRSDFNSKPPLTNELDRLTNFPVYRNCYIEKLKDGESKEDVLNRLLPYYENDILYSFNHYSLPLIVTHKHCARVLMKYLLEMSDEEFLHYRLPEKTLLLIGLNKDFKYETHFEYKY